MKLTQALFVVAAASWSQVAFAVEATCKLVEPNGTVVASFPYEKDPDMLRASDNLRECDLKAMKEAAKLCEADSTKTYVAAATRFVCADKAKVAKLVADQEKRIADLAAKRAVREAKAKKP